jgi:hypothetical protein
MVHTLLTPVSVLIFQAPLTTGFLARMLQYSLCHHPRCKPIYFAVINYMKDVVLSAMVEIHCVINPRTLLINLSPNIYNYCYFFRVRSHVPTVATSPPSPSPHHPHTYSSVGWALHTTNLMCFAPIHQTQAPNWGRQSKRPHAFSQLLLSRRFALVNCLSILVLAFFLVAVLHFRALEVIMAAQFQRRIVCYNA